MKAKDFRELQVSSSLLVVIFLCVLVLGVFIFLLGVSVGKKQVQISAATQVVAQQIQEPAKDQPAQKPAGPGEAENKSPTASAAGSSSQPAPGAGPSAGQASAAKTQTGDKTASPEPQKPAPKSGTGTPTKTPVKTTSKPAAAPATGLFFIQVAAFTDRTQAAAEADKFKKRGYPVVVADPKPTDARTWYRVRVGGFPTREKAAEILTELNEAAKKKTDFRIVKD
ncbi:MAG: SPOR domain-containing protein [Candidatus Aminicenantales bacterium]